MLAYYLSMVQTEEDKNKVIYIYENFYSYMEYKVRRYLKRKQDIEDIVHDSMVKIIDNLDLIDLSDEKYARSMCGIIAKNKAIDFLRVKDNTVLSSDDMKIQDEITEDPIEIVINKDSYKIIVEAINSLSDTFKDVCLLKYVYGLKEREIALLLDLNPKTVNQRIFRGKQILRSLIGKENIHV